jgi:hypothetical protein
MGAIWDHGIRETSGTYKIEPIVIRNPINRQPTDALIY